MKIIIAPDKFKGSLSSIEVCNSLTKGLKMNNSNLNVISCPMADGGDGSLEIINHYLDLKSVEITVNDPLFRPIKSIYYIHEKTAYIEMSSATGLALLKKEDRNCMNTSSYGTGELIVDAIQKGVSSIYLFIGGSATNDGGIGMASALGYRFYDSSENILSPIGRNLILINRIDQSGAKFNSQEVNVKVVCDVNNTFFGKDGAAYVYAAQKGANSIEIKQLELGMINLASKLLKHDFPDIANVPRGGAAGGLGGGSIAFLGAQLISGTQNFIEITKLKKLIKDCDLVITGEGKLDMQTIHGKVISGVCKISKQFNKPIIAVCGIAEMTMSDMLGLKKVYTIIDRANSVDDSIQNVEEYLIQIGANIIDDIKDWYLTKK